MFNIIKKINWYLKENWHRYVIAATGEIFAGIISVMMPQILGNIIDLMAKNQLSFQQFIRNCGALIIVTIIGYIAAVIWNYVLFELGLKFERQFRSKFYNHVMQMGGSFFKHHAVGDLMTRVTTDLKQVSLVTSDGFFFLIEGTVFLSLVILGMLFTGNFVLTAITVLPLLTLTLIVSRFGEYVRKFNTAAQNTLSELSESLLESVSAVFVVRANVKEKENYTMLKNKVLATRDGYAKVDMFDNLNTLVFYFAFGIVELAVLYTGAQMVFNNTITPGSLVTFMLYLNMIGWPLFSLSMVIGVLKRGESSYDRVEQILNEVPEIIDDASKLSVNSFRELEFVDYSFKYPDAAPTEYALSNITFTLRKGETLGIVGKVGGGRSTIIHQLLGEYQLQKTNTLSLNGRSYEQYQISDIRSLFGYVPQEHVLFSKSVKDNLKVAKIDATDAEIDIAIDLADFRKDLTFLHDGLETMTGESGVMLSGGQKQRLAIARAFLSDPEILILDDALSAVDGKTEAKIISNIIENRQNATNIIIAHRLSALTHADQIIVLDNGNIVERGTHQELMAKNGWYKEQFEYQIMEGAE